MFLKITDKIAINNHSADDQLCQLCLEVESSWIKFYLFLTINLNKYNTLNKKKTNSTMTLVSSHILSPNGNVPSGKKLVTIL